MSAVSIAEQKIRAAHSAAFECGEYYEWEGFVAGWEACLEQLAAERIALKKNACNCGGWSAHEIASGRCKQCRKEIIR